MTKDLFGPLFQEVSQATVKEVKQAQGRVVDRKVFRKLSEVQAAQGSYTAGALQPWHRDLVAVLLVELNAIDPVVVNVSALARQLGVKHEVVRWAVSSMVTSGFLVAGPKAFQFSSFTLGPKALSGKA